MATTNIDFDSPVKPKKGSKKKVQIKTPKKIDLCVIIEFTDGKTANGRIPTNLGWTEAVTSQEALRFVLKSIDDLLALKTITFSTPPNATASPAWLKEPPFGQYKFTAKKLNTESTEKH